MSKVSDLMAIGKERRKFKGYTGFKNICEVDKRYDEHGFVSPITKSAHDVESGIMIVLQDWACVNTLVYSKPEETETRIENGYDKHAITNKRLDELLLQSLGKERNQVFVTNLFPFLKPGGKSSSIPQTLLDDSFKKFCLPQVCIVKPKIVICLGRRVYHTFQKHLNKESKSLIVGSNFETGNTHVYYLPHPASRGAIENQKNAWNKMSDFYGKI